jgi:hypothetical protein
MSKASILSAFAIAASSLIAAHAHAALTPTGVACDGHGTAMTSQSGYLDCAGSFSGNNLNQAADVQSQILADFGLSGLATITDITAGNTGSTGSFSFAMQSAPFVISIKAGDAFSLYEFDGGISSVGFDTLGGGFFSGNNNQNVHFGQGLSHASLYASSITTAVPEPETYALLLAGLGVMGFVARRRKS